MTMLKQTKFGNKMICGLEDIIQTKHLLIFLTFAVTSTLQAVI